MGSRKALGGRAGAEALGPRPAGKDRPRWNELAVDHEFWPEEILPLERRSLDATPGPEAAEDHGELDGFFEASRASTEVVVGAEAYGTSPDVLSVAVRQVKRRPRESLWRLHDHASRHTASPAGIENLVARAGTGPGQASALLSRVVTCPSVVETSHLDVPVHRVRLRRPGPTVGISTRAEGTACSVSERPPADAFPERLRTLDPGASLRLSPASFTLAAGEGVPDTAPAVQCTFSL